MRKLTVEEYDRLSPVKKHYYCNALERAKKEPKIDAIQIYPFYPYMHPFYGQTMFWLTRPQLEAATAFYSALVKEREQLRQRLEAEFGEES